MVRWPVPRNPPMFILTMFHLFRLPCFLLLFELFYFFRLFLFFPFLFHHFTFSMSVFPFFFSFLFSFLFSLFLFVFSFPFFSFLFLFSLFSFFLFLFFLFFRFDEFGELDLVARRDIAAGEQITMDYATFCTDEMMDFPCLCQAATCRRTVGLCLLARVAWHGVVLMPSFGLFFISLPSFFWLLFFCTGDGEGLPRQGHCWRVRDPPL
jgi:hypothetical protein